MRCLDISRLLTLTMLLAGAGVFPDSSQAQSAEALSFDTTIELSGSIFEDQNVLFGSAGTATLAPIAALPRASDITGYPLDPNGNQLYSLDTTVDLGNGFTVGPGDVVLFDGATDLLAFDAVGEGIPVGVAVDAVSVSGSGDRHISLVPGGLATSRVLR